MGELVEYGLRCLFAGVFVCLAAVIAAYLIVTAPGREWKGRGRLYEDRE